MKKLIIALIIAVIVFSTPVKAEVIVHNAKATAYCLKGTTATGTTVTEGRTVASKREWFGKTMILYIDDGDGQFKPQNYLGTYIVEDTGSEPVRKGYVIDVYISDYDRAMQFGCKDVIAIIADSEG